MEAGILDYQLCQQNYECDSCSIHLKITRPRSEEIPRHASTEKSIKIRGITISDSFEPGLQYYSNYVWIRHVGHELVTLGIDNLFLNIWDQISRIITRGITGHLTENDSFAWLVMPDGMVNLKIPFAGEVVDVNPLVEPGTFEWQYFRDLPFSESWLLKLKPVKGQPDRNEFMTKQQYLDQVIDDVKIIQSYLRDSPETSSSAPGENAFRLPATITAKLITQLSRGTHIII